MDRPTLRCLVARVLPDGTLSRTRIVTLGEAYILWSSGRYQVVGPDPEDEQALAVWEREQHAPLNTPRWKWWRVRGARHEEA